MGTSYDLSLQGGLVRTEGAGIETEGGAVNSESGGFQTSGSVALTGSNAYVTVQSAPPTGYQTPLVYDNTAVTGGLYAWDGAAYQQVSNVVA